MDLNTACHVGHVASRKTHRFDRHSYCRRRFNHLPAVSNKTYDLVNSIRVVSSRVNLETLAFCYRSVIVVRMKRTAIKDDIDTIAFNTAVYITTKAISLMGCLLATGANLTLSNTWYHNRVVRESYATVSLRVTML